MDKGQVFRDNSKHTPPNVFCLECFFFLTEYIKQTNKQIEI